MDFQSKKTKYLIANVLLVTVFCFILNSFVNYEEYTLMQSGKWQSTKAELKKGCGAAWAYMFTKTALSKNHLNISIWNGYQELIYKRPMQFGSVNFNYYSGYDFFSFIVDKNDSLEYGVHFNNVKPDECFAFIANNEGRFLHKYYFKTEGSINTWNNANIVRKSDSLLVKVNGILRFKEKMLIPSIVRPGFKGGGNEVIIDDIVIKNPGGLVIEADNFSPPFQFHTVILLLAALVLVLVGRFIVKRQIAPSLIYVNICMIIGLVFAYGVYFFWLSGRYPITSNSADWHGMQHNIDGEREIEAMLNNKYPMDSIAGRKKVILFLGSSQTWGSGATSDSNTMPARIEKNVQHFFNDTSIIIINCGIAGFTSNRVYNFYNTKWYKYKPILTVINLSTNDGSDTMRFARSMKDFLVFNKNRGINTILIQEPNCFVSDQLLVNHVTLKKLGTSFGVRVFPMQNYMDSLQSTGFLWWDYVHCTDYGYYLMSERITPLIIQTLQEKKHLTPPTTFIP